MYGSRRHCTVNRGKRKAWLRQCFGYRGLLSCSILRSPLVGCIVGTKHVQVSACAVGRMEYRAEGGCEIDSAVPRPAAGKYRAGALSAHISC